VSGKFKTCISLAMMIILIILCGFINNGDIAAKRSEEVKGKLLIVGGALEPGNKEVYEKFINMAGGRKNSFIGIISTASSDPIEAAADFKNELVKIYGVPGQNVKFIPIYYDEVNAGLKSNVNEEECIKIIEHCTGIWFTGGDQRRIVSSLYKKDRSYTKMLNEIHKIHKRGAVIGGTSAGAAIMGSTMITGGDNKSALTNPEIWNFNDLSHEDSSTLSIGQGLGLFAYGIVDQHFSERDRLGRLIAVCSKVDDGGIGFGIDENTAIVVNENSGIIEAIGEGGVIIVNTKAAAVEPNNKKLNIKNVRVSYLASGGVYNAKSNKMLISGKKEKLQKASEANISGSNKFDNSCNEIKRFLLKNLDNSAGVDRLKFLFPLGIHNCEFILSKDYITNLLSSEDCAGFTAENIRLDIKIND
jgi:cyanophycinase